MIRVFKEYYCDACGQLIFGYKSHVDLMKMTQTDSFEGDTCDFCKECTISFNEWKKSRQRKEENVNA